MFTAQVVQHIAVTTSGDNLSSAALIDCLVHVGPFKPEVPPDESFLFGISSPGSSSSTSVLVQLSVQNFFTSLNNLFSVQCEFSGAAMKTFPTALCFVVFRLF